MHIEGFAQAETRGDGAYNGNERIEDGHFAYGIATEKLVVEGKTQSRDAYEREQDKASDGSDVGQGATHQQSRNDEQGASQAKAIASAHEDIDTTR